MAFPIAISYSKEILSRRSPNEVYDYLANWEEAIPGNFPGIKSFQSVGPNQYHWTFEKLAHSGKEIEISFSTEFQKSVNKLEMTPLPKSGSATLQGSWTIEQAGSGTGTRIRFQAELELELPLPGFLKSMVAPIATKELHKLFDLYAHRLEKTLG